MVWSARLPAVVCYDVFCGTNQARVFWQTIYFLTIITVNNVYAFSITKFVDVISAVSFDPTRSLSHIIACPTINRMCIIHRLNQVSISHPYAYS